MKFAMPLGGNLEIKSDPPLDPAEEMNMPYDMVVEGVVWQIFWNGLALPWYTETKLQAMAIAFGCQYGATRSNFHPNKMNSDE